MQHVNNQLLGSFKRLWFNVKPPMIILYLRRIRADLGSFDYKDSFRLVYYIDIHGYKNFYMVLKHQLRISNTEYRLGYFGDVSGVR